MCFFRLTFIFVDPLNVLFGPLIRRPQRRRIFACKNLGTIPHAAISRRVVFATCVLLQLRNSINTEKLSVAGPASQLALECQLFVR